MSKQAFSQKRIESNWNEAPDAMQLNLAAASWCSRLWRDPDSNRRFLSLFAVYLVKHFKAEEDRLVQAKAPGQAWHRREHRRLVSQLRDLIRDLELGLDMSPGIHRYLRAWQCHQESAYLRIGRRDAIYPASANRKPLGIHEIGTRAQG